MDDLFPAGNIIDVFFEQFPIHRLEDVRATGADPVRCGALLENVLVKADIICDRIQSGEHEIGVFPGVVKELAEKGNIFRAAQAYRVFLIIGKL